MSNKEFTLTDLRRILREAAGEDESVDLDGDILDVEFEELGYESLALLEAGSRIEREFNIRLDDETLTESMTPGSLIKVINAQLAITS
ncbi:acyl carrier protein [Nocardiopsis sp. ATB16-24]|uniref:acyl carrier protein n=1 Tax=Nocardiopsis sp. ATB16-24 TaxID=3019555 RepID=UPI0025577BC5|nr:acyl carrier protein [Nocardiopsis sp. ATB16-24]